MARDLMKSDEVQKKLGKAQNSFVYDGISPPQSGS
jgi:hypothetical protein